MIGDLSELSTAALEAEQNKHYPTAAQCYAMIGAVEITNSDGYGRYHREGLANILQAIYYEIKAGNLQAANRFLDIYRAQFETTIEHASSAVVRGFADEWLGDALVLIGDGDRATDRYTAAIDEFDDLDFDTQWFYGASPEYDIAYSTFESFCGDNGIEYYRDHDRDFVGRVEWKLGIVSELV